MSTKTFNIAQYTFITKELRDSVSDTTPSIEWQVKLFIIPQKKRCDMCVLFQINTQTEINLHFMDTKKNLN